MFRAPKIFGFSVLALAFTSVTQAAPIVTSVSIVGNSFDFAQNGGIGTGHRFTNTLSGVQVNSLGVYYPTPGTYGATTVTANTGTEQLVLAQITGAGTADVIAQVQVNVDAGTNAPDGLGFQYATLSAPVVLTQGASYLLLTNTKGNWEANNSGGVNITLAAGFTALGAYASFATVTGSGWASGVAVTDTIAWSDLSSGDTDSAYGPVNFQYQIIPEPGSMSLLWLGCVGVAALRRTFNRRSRG